MTLPALVGEYQTKIPLHNMAKNHNRKYLGDSLSASVFTKKMNAWCRANGYDYETGKAINIMWKDEGEIEPRLKSMEHVKIVQRKEAKAAATEIEDDTPY